jgi:hypothetical protein
MRARQEQSGGADSVNIQAGNNAVVHVGITATEAIEIADGIFWKNFLTMGGTAEAVLRERVERFVRDFVSSLQRENPIGLESMRDPDMLRALYAAQEGYACSGEDDLEQTLIDLLVDRAGQEERDLTTHVLNQAISTVPKLTIQQRAALAIIFFIRCSRFVGPLELAAFYKYVRDYLAPFIDSMPQKRGDYLYMQYTGVGSMSLGSIELEKSFYESAFGYFANGFTREVAALPWQDRLDDPEIFMPCLRDSSKLQIRARSISEVEELGEKKNLPSLVTHAATGRMQPGEMRDDLIAHVPSMEKLFDNWDSLGMSHFELTAVGIAIAHACQRRVVGGSTSLDVFLS